MTNADKRPSGSEVSDDELRSQEGEKLPDREVMSTVRPGAIGPEPLIEIDDPLDQLYGTDPVKPGV
jgi:hypothetical protein